jgi:hypothetical protein
MEGGWLRVGEFWEKREKEKRKRFSGHLFFPSLSSDLKQPTNKNT